MLVILQVWAGSETVSDVGKLKVFDQLFENSLYFTIIVTSGKET